MKPSKTEDLTRSVEEIILGFIDDITPPAIAFALGEAVPAVTAKLADYMTKHDLKFIPADETIALIARQTPRPARTFLLLYYMFSRFVAVRALNGQPIHEDIPFEKGVSNGNDRLYDSGMYAKYGEVKVVFDSSGDMFTLTAEDLNIFAAGYRYQQERNRHGSSILPSPTAGSESRTGDETACGTCPERTYLTKTHRLG